MNAAGMAYARSSGRPRRLVLDPWLTGSVLALLLIGLVMVASASIGVSEREARRAFLLLSATARCSSRSAWWRPSSASASRPQVWEKQSIWLLAGAFLLLTSSSCRASATRSTAAGAGSVSA